MIARVGSLLVPLVCLFGCAGPWRPLTASPVVVAATLGFSRSGALAWLPGASLWTRGQTFVPCVGRQIPDRWTTRLVLWFLNVE